MLCAGVGLSNFQYANMASMRNIFIIGFSLYNGLSIAHYFETFEENEGHGPVNTGNQEFNGAPVLACAWCATGCGVVCAELQSGTGTPCQQHTMLPHRLVMAHKRERRSV